MAEGKSLYDHWPELMREVGEALGTDAALRLVSRCGGQEVYIPERAQGSAFARTVGDDIAFLLADMRGGEKVDVPNFYASQLAEERRRFILTHPDLTANDCARRLGITSRRVRQIREENSPDPRQLDIFAEVLPD